MFVDDKNWVEVSSTENLQVGDILYMRVAYKYQNLWSKSIAAYYAEKDINKSDNYEVMSINYNDDPGYFWFKLKVVNKNPQIQTASLFSVGVLITIVLAITVVGLKVFNEPKIWKYKLQIAVINAVESGNMSVAEATGVINELTDLNETADTSIGSQVKKAGVGVAIAIAAGIGLIYILSRRKS